jgi:ABC-type transporter Mla subunit MlaD
MTKSVDIADSKAARAITRRLPAADRLAEIRHPLSAIVANADAARRWLRRTDPNFHEALAALDRIVKESARIDDAIAGIRAAAPGKNPDIPLA